MICINIAEIVFRFINIPEHIRTYIVRKYESFIVTSSFGLSEIDISINCFHENSLYHFENIKIGMTVNNCKNTFILYCDNISFGNAILDLENSCCDIELDYFSEYAIDLFLSVIWRFISPKYERILLHASAISIEDKAFLFCGHSGDGKSTILDILQQHALTDEMACISFDSNIAPYYFSIPWRNCYMENNIIPLKKIFLLEKSEKAASVNIHKKIAYILLQKYLYFNLWTTGSRDIVNKTLLNILESTPVEKLCFHKSSDKNRILEIIGGM